MVRLPLCDCLSIPLTCTGEFGGSNQCLGTRALGGVLVSPLSSAGFALQAIPTPGARSTMDGPVLWPSTADSTGHSGIETTQLPADAEHFITATGS